MSNFKLSRRTVIRGAGSIAIALPWLEVMGIPRASAQAAKPANRFLVVYQPGGVQQTPINGVQRYWPSGGETSFTLSPILAPLEPLKDKLIFLRGIRLACANEANDAAPHPSGCQALLTGSEQIGGELSYSLLPSVDQMIATRISKGKKRKASLTMAVRWATGLTRGRLHTQNAICFEDSAKATPIPPAVDPVAIYNDLFGTLSPQTPGMADPILARKKSVLDFVDKRYVTLINRVGAADKARLQEHLDKIREIEKGLSVNVVMGAQCRPPQKVDTSRYDPQDGLNSEKYVDGGRKSESDALIPLVGKYMLDMMIMALACDITAVGNFQWSDSEAQHSLPWLNLSENHHYYQHDNGFRPVELEKIATWYSEQNAYVVQQMAKVDMGGHTLLDESVVFFCSEIGWPESHSQQDMPFMLAGGGGGLRTGRLLNFNNVKTFNEAGIPHNNLLVALLNIFGDPRTSVQQAGRSYCNNPIKAQLV